MIAMLVAFGLATIVGCALLGTDRRVAVRARRRR